VCSTAATTPLAPSLPFTRVLLGSVISIDASARTCTVRTASCDREVVEWDRLVLNPGSVMRTVGIPGVLAHARGFKTLAEALYLREQILSQLQHAAASSDPRARAAHASFEVVVGGFTGLELAAHGRELARAALRQHPRLDAGSVRWTVLEAGPTVLTQFPETLARKALTRLRKRSVDPSRDMNYG
jgi:NADH:quinone reductase (non-electrogenic)